MGNRKSTPVARVSEEKIVNDEAAAPQTTVSTMYSRTDDCDYVRLEDTPLEFFYNDDKLELLLQAYLHDINIVIPTELHAIFLSYLKQEAAYFTIYDSKHATLETVQSTTAKDAKHEFESYQILKGKQTSTTTTDIVFLCELPMNEGVHTFVFHCIASHPNDKLGIISEGDLDKLKAGGLGKVYMYSKSLCEYRYFWWRHTRKVRTHDARIPLEGIGRWDVGNQIKMEVDCDSWSLRYFDQDVPSQSISIHHDVTYYAFLSFGGSDAEFHYKLT